MAKRHLEQYDKNGNKLDIYINDDEVMVGDQTLAEKLADMEDDIGDAAQTGGEGTVTGVKVGSNTYEPTDGVVDLSTPFSGKVDKVNGKGLSTNDYTDADKTKLQNLPTATELTTQLGGKANDNAVVKSISVNGTQQSKDSSGNVAISGLATTQELTQGLSGKQNTLTFDDAPGNTDNPVKSRGIKQAIEFVTPTIDANGKWVIGGVATDKDAQGPRGNSVLVNEGSTAIQGIIVNNVVDGGETEILSAEMGKVLRQNIVKIFNALGTYAFPEGKPTLNWDSTVVNYSINTNGVTGGLTISDVEVDGTSVGSLPSQIVEGKSLSLKLNLPSNLYIYDAVAITMGGVDITSNTGVWDESTGVVNIASVTDDVVVTATSMTYVLPSNLAFNLDCKNVGSNAGYWTDLVGGTKFKLTDVTINDSGAVFNGTTSKGVVMDGNDPTQPAALGSKYVDVAFDAGTIEVIAEADSGSLPTENNRVVCPVFINPKDGGLIAAFRMGGSSTAYASCVLFMYTCRSSGVLDDNLAFLYNGSTTIDGVTYTANGGNNIAVSAHTNLTVDGIVRIDGITQQNAKWFDTWIGGPAQTRFSVGYYYRNNNGTITEAFFKGKIKAIRVYSTKLTEQQMIQNYKVDKKRFNLQ